MASVPFKHLDSFKWPRCARSEPRTPSRGPSSQLNKWPHRILGLRTLSTAVSPPSRPVTKHSEREGNAIAGTPPPTAKLIDQRRQQQCSLNGSSKKVAKLPTPATIQLRQACDPYGKCLTRYSGCKGQPCSSSCPPYCACSILSVGRVPPTHQLAIQHAIL